MEVRNGIISDFYNVLRLTRNIYDKEREGTQEVWDYISETEIIYEGKDTAIVDEEKYKRACETIEYIYNKYDCWTKETCYKRLVCSLRNNINI